MVLYASISERKCLFDCSFAALYTGYKGNRKRFMLRVHKKQNGFTIVELLIVIVVIAILAAISVVAYSGVQSRARDAQRASDVVVILKALELYKADNGTYPPGTSSPHGNGCTGNGYSYSWATDGTWMKELVDGNYLSKVPVPPKNDCTNSHYAYIRPSASSYGCAGKRTTPYYILWVTGAEGGEPPSGANLNGYTPCEGATASWGTNGGRWVFTKDG